MLKLAWIVREKITESSQVFAVSLLFADASNNSDNDTGTDYSSSDNTKFCSFLRVVWNPRMNVIIARIISGNDYWLIICGVAFFNLFNSFILLSPENLEIVLACICVSHI